MIVAAQKGFIFLHNPKCGGTTVRNALMRFDTTGNFFWMVHEHMGRKLDKAHLPLHVCKMLFPEIFAEFQNNFVFMFVRNPYTRAVSAFNESHKDLLPLDTDEAVAKHREALNAFIHGIKPNELNGMHFKYRHFVRQSDMCFIERKRHVDVAMKIEDWPDCLDKLNRLPNDVVNKLRNAQKRNVKAMPISSTTDLLDEASLTKINNLYADDFIHFDYPVMNPATRELKA